MATTILGMVGFSSVAMADGFYASVEGGVSNSEMNLKGKHFDDNDTGTVLGAAVGYDKKLNFGILKNRGTDNVRVEGLFDWRAYDYNQSFKGHKGAVSANVNSFSFMPNIYYDAKSLHLYQSADARTKVYPYVGAGLGIAYNSVSDTKLKYGPYKASVSDGDNWDMAWNIGAGLTADLPKDWAVSGGWRYVDLGEAASGDTVNLYGYAVGVRKKHADLTAHEFTLRVTKKF